jgi:hypothetical protein
VIGAFAFALQAAGADLPPAAPSVFSQEWGRAAGAEFWSCRIKHAFALPGRGGGAALMGTREGKRVSVKPWPGAVRENVDAAIEVEADGRTSGLAVSWVQSGGLGWPYVWREDLGPIGMTARFERRGIGPAQPSFDPAALLLELSVHSAKKLKGPLLFHLWREGQKAWLLGLGGEARIPPWRHSAAVNVRWADVALYAQGQRELSYEFIQPMPFPYDRVPDPLAAGNLDIAVMPRVLEAFRAAEAELLSVAADKEKRCEKQVEPEMSPEATIGVSATRMPAIPPRTGGADRP